MDRIFFEEKQKQPGQLLWLVLFAGLALCFPFAYTLYVRNILDYPMDEKALNNQQAVAALSLLVLVVVFVLLLFSSMYLQVKIDQGGIHYRFFPHHRKTQFLEKAAIVEYTIRKLKWNEIIRSTKTKKFGRADSNQYYRITGNIALELKVHGGRKLILSTHDPEGLTWAMKRLLSNP